MLNPASRVAVLGHAFEGCDVVDFSPIDGLKPVELLAVAKYISAQTGSPRCISLILPNMRTLTAGILKEVLDTARIASLDLGHTAVSLKGLLNVVNTASLDSLTCPALYKSTFERVMTGEVLEKFRRDSQACHIRGHLSERCQ
jgi:hypothetical protein